MRTLGAQGDATATPESSPEEGPYWSLMFEVSESELKPVNNEPESLAGARRVLGPAPCADKQMATPAEARLLSLYAHTSIFASSAKTSVHLLPVTP